MQPGLWLNRGLWREALKYDSGARKYLHTDAFTQNFFHESKGFPFIWKEFKLPPFDHLQIFKLIYGHSHLLLPLCSSLPPSKAIFTRTGVPSPPDFSRLPPRLSLSVLCCSILSYLSWFSICSIHYWEWDIDVSNYYCRIFYFCLQFCKFLPHIFWWSGIKCMSVHSCRG